MSQFVVYQLVDPRTKAIFYIGSGKKGRPYEHFTLAANGKPGRKNDKVREIMATGVLPIVEVTLETEDRDWAYECEKHLIKSTPGLLNDQGAKEQAVINFIDEFFACFTMKPEHRRKRFARLLRTFTYEQCSKHAGYARLWLAMLQSCAGVKHGKA